MSAAVHGPRDGRGRFTRLACVNAHDRCHEGGPCPYCEPLTKARTDATGEGA